MSRNNVLLFRLIVSVVLVCGILIYQHAQPHKTTGHTTQPTQTIPISESTDAKCHMNGLLPDPNCTPGAVNTNVTQDNIGQTICASGFTKTIRPPASYTDKLKVEQMQEYGFTDALHNHEEDHLISLELGGSPDDPKNLWPEPGNTPNPKDKVEDYLHTAVCDGRISLHDAQTKIATDWTTAENGIK